ncbi:unnamed protein product [Cuscuta europaea]|uniref:Retrotransposon gag domain-containing protein n=1 Tax=Cuscuta europaea TaxID=41803 RepID=A0A9P0Z9S1_CUSEU|nr:unnamed protein product [Cuscuta europaea]
MVRTTRANSKNVEDKNLALGDVNAPEASHRAPEGGVIAGLEQAAVDLRLQIQQNAPDARLGIEAKKKNRSDDQVSPPVLTIDVQSALSAFIQTLTQNPGAFGTLAPAHPQIGENIILPPLPHPFGNPTPRVRNDEGVVAQETSSQEVQSRDRHNDNRERPRTSALNRLGGGPDRRGVQDRLGGKALQRPQESGGSVSRADEERPPRDKSKAPLHADDARHQINQAHSARVRSQGAETLPRDPRDEIIAALQRRLDEMESNKAHATTSTPHSDLKYEAMMAKMEELQKKVAEGSGEPVIQLRTRTPFTPRVLAARIPEKYRGQHIQPYSGKTDPQEHYSKYQNSMMMVGASDEYLCHWFLSTLEGPAYEWFNRLPEGCIDSWQELAQRFLTQFAGRRRTRKHFSHLLTIRQKKDETLRDFLERWRTEADKVDGADDGTLLALLQTVLRTGNFSRSLIIEPPPPPPRDYIRALQRGDRYAEAEEVEKYHQHPDQQPPRADNKHNRGPGAPKNHPKTSGSSDDRPRQGQAKPGGGYKSNPKTWAQPILLDRPRTPLTHPVSIILDFAEERGLVERDSRAPPEVHAINPQFPYCRFHRHQGHMTDDCHQLKTAIERLIQAGHLSQFVQSPRQEGPSHQGPPRGHHTKVNAWVNPNTIPLGKKREIGNLEKEEEEYPHHQEK